MDAKRYFLEAVLTTGIESKIISPDDVLRHIEPDVLAAHLPDAAKTQLLSASLKAGKMDAALVFEVIDPRVFAEHMPEAMLWSCIAEAAERVLEGGAQSSRPAGPGVAAGKPTSLLGDTAGSRLAAQQRRPNASRRPARLSQPLPRTTTPGAPTPGTATSSTGKRPEFELDDIGQSSSPAITVSGVPASAASSAGSGGLSAAATVHSGSAAGLTAAPGGPVSAPGVQARTGKEPLDEHFSDWIEETVTGPEALNRRKR